MFTAFAVVPAFLSSKGMTAALWLFYGMFVLFAIVAWYCVLTFVCEITISPDQLICRSLVGRKVITRDHIRDVQIQVAGRSSSVTIRMIPKGSRTIFLKSFASSLGDALHKWKDSQPASEQLKNADQEYGMRGIGHCFLGLGLFLGAFVICGGYEIGGIIPALVIGIPFGGVWIVIAFDCYRSYVRLTPNEIIVVRFGKQSTVRWPDITEVKMKTYRTKNGIQESLQICSTNKPVSFGRGYDNFPVLRDAILKRVDPAKITDTRARQ